MKTNAKENLLFVVLAIFLAVSGWAADAANDLLIMQRNAANDDNVQRNVTAGQGYSVTFNSTYVPVSSSALVLPYTGSANITLTPAATGAISLQGPIVAGSPTGGAPASGIINAEGFKINGVDVASSSDTYWNADAPGIKYTAGPVSLKGTPTGDAGDMQVEDLTADTINGTVTLGASGPALGSSLSARAPAQGLVFDGTAGATVSGVPAFGTGDFTVVVAGNTSSISAGNAIALYGDANSFSVYRDGSALKASFVGTADILTASTALVAGQNTFRVYTRSGTTGTWYNNGVADGTDTDASNYSVAVTKVGSNLAGTGSVWSGTLRVLIYNRALSAAEVVSLYESGPSGADYHQTAQAVVSPTRNSVFSAGATDWGAADGASISVGGSVVITPTSLSRISLDPAQVGAVLGARMKISVTVANYVAGTDVPVLRGTLQGGDNVNITGDGTFSTAEFTCTNASQLYQIINLTGTGSGSNTTFDITSFVVTIYGLVLSPDYTGAANYQVQGLRGTSGDITIPASGVTLSYPSNIGTKQVRATLTWAGSHEAKSLLGQVAIPSNAVITSIITTASAGSAGAGLTVGSVTTPNLFVAANSYTTAKEVHTLAAQLPAGSATNDLSLVLDPDDQNYTGTIQIAVNYIIAQ